jgi:hypothetical protein
MNVPTKERSRISVMFAGSVSVIRRNGRHISLFVWVASFINMKHEVRSIVVLGIVSVVLIRVKTYLERTQEKNLIYTVCAVKVSPENLGNFDMLVIQ